MVGGEQQQQEDDGLQQKDKKQQNKQQHKKQQTENPKKKQDIDTLTRSVTNIAKGIGLLFFGILGIVAFVVTTAYEGIKYVFKDAEKVRNDGEKKT